MTSNNGWSVVPLGDVLFHRKEFIQIDDLTKYKRCCVQLHAKGVVLRDEVEGAVIKTKSQQVCRTDEFLVAEIDAKVGGYGLVPGELDGAIVSSHYFLFPPNRSRLDPKFLAYFVRTPNFRDQVAARGSTNYAAIRPHHVLAYKIPLPPLPEQRRIVAKIERLAAKIDEARKASSDAIFERSVLGNRVAKDCFEPLGRYMTRIGATFRVTTGGTPSRSNPSYWNGTIPWVSSGEVAFCRISTTNERITEFGVHDSNAKINPPHTVLIAMIGQGKTRGQCAILDCAAATNQNVAAIHVHETEHVPEYIYHWLFTQYLESRSAEIGTAQPALSGRRVREMQIPIPPVDEQRRIVAYLDGLQAKVDELKRLQTESAAELGALLPAILDRAFKGEL